MKKGRVKFTFPFLFRDVQYLWDYLLYIFLDRDASWYFQIVFESGFTGFIGLTITSLVWVGSLLLNAVYIYKLFADVLRIGEKKG
jgi:hypothetical protein